MRLTRITIAVTDMSAMRRFYDTVFDAGLHPISAYGTTLYEGQLAGLELLMCPNEIAGVEAQQNRKQLRIAVPDLDAITQRATVAGGSIRNQTADLLGVVDPDGNTIEFVQEALQVTE